MTLSGSRGLLGKAQLLLPRVSHEKAENWSRRGAHAESVGRDWPPGEVVGPLRSFLSGNGDGWENSDWEWSPPPADPNFPLVGRPPLYQLIAFSFFEK